MTRFRRPKERKRTKCDLCGGYSSELKQASDDDFYGWVCPECREILQGARKKRFRASGEHTEPAE